MLGVLPHAVVTELLDGMAGYAACGFHCHKWEAGFIRLLRAAGTDGATDVRGPARARRGVLEEEAASPAARRRPPRCAPRWAGGGSSPGPTAWSPRRTSCGDAGLRGAALDPPEWRGEVVHVAFAYPSRQGLAEYLAYGADVVHTAERINHAFGSGGRVDAHPALGRGRPGPFARRA